MLVFTLLPSLLTLPLVMGLSVATPCPAPPRTPAVSLRVAQTPTDPDVQVRMLLAAIRRKKDDTIERQFRLLGRIGTEQAFEALKTCVEWLSRPDPLYYAYGSFREFKGDLTLSRKAIAYLANQALKASPTARAQAARALGKWSERAHDELEQLVHESKDKDVRGHAVAAILPELFYRGDEKSLRMILENVSPHDTYRLAANLSRFTAVTCRGIFKDLTLDKRNDPHLRALVIDHLVKLEGKDIDHVLAKLVADREESVQVAAIDGLKLRGSSKLAKDRLWTLMSSRKLDVRLAAIQALGKLLVDDEKWTKRLYQLSVNRDPNSRMGAAYGLFEQGDEQAIEALYGLLGDKDWRVRVAALKNVEKVRTPRTVGILIARLDVETGRLHVDVARALQDLTGMNLGAKTKRWHAWWKDHRTGYVVPQPLDNKTKRTRKAIEGASVATFYGLPVFSNYTTFVMDTSGSMSQKTRGFEGDYSEGGRISRLAVARDQLKKLLAQMPDGHHCNVIFFNGELNPWSETLKELEPDTRRDLNAFVDKVMPKGGTNIYDALILAMEDPQCDTIYILSDGQPTSGRIVQLDGIRRRVLQLNRRANVQFFGISVGLISELFEDLSAATGGRYVELGISAREASSRAHEILLRVDASEEELAKALARAKQSTRIDPRSSQYRTALGIAYFRNGYDAQARKDLQAAAGLEGAGEARLKATRLAFLCRIHARQGQLEQARALLEEARALLAEYPRAGINVFLDWAEAEITTGE